MARRIAAFGAAEGAPIEIPEGLWTSVLGILVRQSLTGLAWSAAEAGCLGIDSGSRQALLEAHRTAMMHSLAVEQQLVAVAALFGSLGIDFVVLKGPAHAHAFYPDPALRPCRDLDVLVRTGDWRAACAGLEAMGVTRKLPEPRPGFDERFGKAATHRAANGVEIDLHRTLVLGPFGLLIDAEELFHHRSPLYLGGQTTYRLDDGAALLHGCVHAALGWRPPLLLPLRDVAQIAPRREIDWAVVEDLVRRWRLAAVVQSAFELVHRVLDIEPPASARSVTQLPAGRFERRAVGAYESGRRRRARMALSTVRAIRGVSGKARYVWALLLPTPRFIRARGEGSYWGRWGIALRWFLPSRGRDRTSRGPLRRTR